jgi:hypothetical protein
MTAYFVAYVYVTDRTTAHGNSRITGAPIITMGHVRAIEQRIADDKALPGEHVQLLWWTELPGDSEPATTASVPTNTQTTATAPATEDNSASVNSPSTDEMVMP